MMNILALVVMQASVANFELQQYHEVYRTSVDSGKPFLVIIGADWCQACQVLKNKTLPQVNGNGGLRGVRVAYVDLDRDKALAKRLMKGRMVPQVVRFQHDGSEWDMTRLNGDPNPQSLTDFARVPAVDSDSSLRSTSGKGSSELAALLQARWPITAVHER